jgi:hypothetical protein
VVRYPDVVSFGRALVETGDLDPLYVALQGAREARLLGTDQLSRWLVAYWCFYHAGTASWISEADSAEFWRRMRSAAGEAPRGRERRHFRGPLAYASVASLLDRWPQPEHWIDALSICDSAASVIELVRLQHGFGPWIAFKAADMLERLGIAVLRFGPEVAMYAEPMEGAMMVVRDRFGREPLDLAELRETVEGLRRAVEDLPAPPRGERPCGYQEVETVLCKWKAHCQGHYPLGIDSHELERALRWGTQNGSNRTAEALLRFAPRATTEALW